MASQPRLLPWGLCLVAITMAAISSGCSSQNDSKESRLKRANEYLTAGQYEKAAQEYRQILGIDPSDSAAQQQLAIIYYDEGQLRQAFPLLKKTAEGHPDNLNVQLKLALTYFAGRDLGHARELAAQILEKAPAQEDALLLMVDTSSTPDEMQATHDIVEKLKDREQDRVAYHLARGALELRQKNEVQAEAEFKTALAINPKSAAVHSALGRLYWSKQDITAASQAFKEASDLSPPRSPMRLQYVDFKLKTGATAEATKLVEDIARQVPDYLPTRVFLMRIACAEKQGDDCVARVDSILAQDDLNYDALFQSGVLSLGKGENTRAIRIFEQLTSMNESDPRIRYQLALAYLASTKDATPVNSRKALNSAERNLNVAVQLNPKFEQAVLLLSELNIKKGTPAAAVDLLVPFVKERPQTAQAQYLLASAYLAQQQTDQALAVLQKMAELFPKDPQPPFLIGQVLLGRRQVPEARQEFEKSVEIAPDYQQAVERLVDLDLADKQYAAAIGRVQKVIDKDPKLAQPWAIRGKIYLAQGDFTHAEPDLLKAIELDPKLEPAYLLLSQLYLAANKQDQAIAKLSSFVDNNKDDKNKTVPALMQLAMIQQGLQRFDAARDAYEKALAVTPNLVLALNNLAVLYSERLGQLDKAYDLAKRARQAAPNEPHVADTLGWIAFKKADYAIALPLLQDSAGKLPDAAEIQFHVGMAHYMLGDEAPARLALQKAADATADFPGKDDARRRLAVLAIQVDAANATARTELENFLRDQPNDPMALARLADIQQRDGAEDQAIKTYEKVVAANPLFAPAMRQLALLYGRRSTDDPKAFDIATKARQAYPDDPDVAKTLGILNYRRDLIPQSAELLKQAAANRKDDPELLYYLGEDYRQLKQWSECKDALQRALSLNIPSALSEAAKRALADCAETSPL